MACEWYNPLSYGDCAADKTAGIAKQAVGSAFDSVVKAFIDGLTAAMKGLLTFWTAVPTPDVGDGGSGQAIGAVAQLQQWTSPLLFGAAVLGLVVGGARLALSARGGRVGAGHRPRPAADGARHRSGGGNRADNAGCL